MQKFEVYYHLLHACQALIHSQTTYSVSICFTGEQAQWKGESNKAALQYRLWQKVGAADGRGHAPRKGESSRLDCCRALPQELHGSLLLDII